MPVGNTVTLNMGFRVYEDATKTRARVHRDYFNVSYELLPETVYQEIPTGATYMSVAGACILTALVFTMSF